MKIDLKDAKEIIVIVDDRRHKAEFVEEKSVGEFFFKIMERNHPYIRTKTGHRCQVLITSEEKGKVQNFFFEGKIVSEFLDEATIWASTPMLVDRRREYRYPAPPVIVMLERKRFLRSKLIDARIININHLGAAVSISEPLSVNSEYKFDTKFRIRAHLHSFSAMFTVKHTTQMGSLYINRYACGGEFNKSSISSGHKKILKEFILHLSL